MENVTTERRGFLDRKTMRLRWVLILLVVVALVGAGFWAAKTLECRSVARRCETGMREQLEASAENEARAISVVGNKMIVAEDYAALQGYVDDLVKHKPLAYIAVVDNGGKAVVHTDRKYLGERFAEPEDVVSASVPVMSFTRQVATVWVGVRKPVSVR